MSPNLSAKTSGFTLIELMITVAVLAIVASIALPAFSDQVKSYELRSTALQTASRINELRAEAMIQRADQTLTVGEASGWTRNPSGTLPETLTLTPDGIVTFSGTAASPVIYTITEGSKSKTVLVYRRNKAEVL